MNALNLKAPLIKLYFLISVTFFFVACNEAQIKDENFLRFPSNHSQKFPFIPESGSFFKGISIVNCGPRGGVFNSKKGNSISYRIFRIQIYNDTTCTVQLKINIPNLTHHLLPDSSQTVKVFLFPDYLQPNSQKDTMQFGLKEVEPYLEKALLNNSEYAKDLKPSQSCFIYFGCIMDGVARARLFLEGETINESYLAVNGNDSKLINRHSLNVFFGLANIDPQSKIVLPIGELFFLD